MFFEAMTGALTSASQGMTAAASSAVEVDLDLTVVGQIVLFCALWVVLKPVLFDPMLKLFDEREKRIDGAKLKARHIDQESIVAQTRYETAMAKARAEASVDRDKLRAQAAKTEAELLAQARADAAKTLETGRAILSQEAAAARETLRRGTTSLAREVAGRALGREVGVELGQGGGS